MFASLRFLPVRFIVLAALLIGLTNSRALAQTTSSANPTLSAVLTDVISLTANVTSVQLRFQNANDYNNGVTNTATNQLNITSNKAYTLQVRASGDLTNGSATPVTIPINSVGLTANWATGLTGSIPGITNTAQTLNASAAATQSQNISMTYAVTGANAANFLKPAGTYTTTLTFTATQN